MTAGGVVMGLLGFVAAWCAEGTARSFLAAGCVLAGGVVGLVEGRRAE